MRTSLRLSALGLLVLAAGCGGHAVRQGTAVTPDDIPSLEAAAAADADAGVLTRLGAAYHVAGRHRDAVDVLEDAAARPDAPAAAHLYLGLAHEALDGWEQASDAYVAFMGRTDAPAELRELAEERMPLVERRLMEAQLREMVAQEDALSRQPPEPRTVAVLPFRIASADPRYQPLEAALADMVTTDLGVPGTLRLLERARVEALVREMALTLAGFTDASTAARVGRLLRTEHVVQGSAIVTGDERLRLEMAIAAPAEGGERVGEARGETELQRIFDAEKALVFQAFDILGVPLTPAERERIEENRTSSLVALLTYGEGLQALDRGDFGAASTAFREASRLDPAFQAAAVRQTQADDLAQAEQTTAAQVAAAGADALPPGSEPTGMQSLADQLIPSINRSGADQTMGLMLPGGDVASNPTIEDPHTNVGGTAAGVGIVIDVPNPR